MCFVRRERSTSRASRKERQLLPKICSTCKLFSNLPAGGNSREVRTRACCSRRGCFVFKISSVCKNSSSLPDFLTGVSALFTWGVIAENGTTHIAVVPGGWTEDQLEDPTTYLKVSLVNTHPQIVTMFFFS